MKDHVWEKRYVHLTGDLMDVLDELAKASLELVNPRVDCEGWDYQDYFVCGWRPMNEKELAKAKRERAAEREHKKKQKEKKEQEERQELERLKAKYERT